MTARLLGAGAMLVACLTLASCSADDPDEPDITAATSTTGPATYKAFADVDPYTEVFFINLEDTGLAASQGEERLWNLGVGVCRDLDQGEDVEAVVRSLVEEAKLGDDAGSVVGAATAICPTHKDAVVAWGEAYGG